MLLEELKTICTDLGLGDIQLREFQVEFFSQAVAGTSGFLRVRYSGIVFSQTILKAPCGMGKSLLYQLLPFVLSKSRHPSIANPVVIVVQPLKAISESNSA